MKSLKSKVILSAVVLIFALVATIGSTFAWFTVSSTVTASDITLNVTTADSLLIKIAPTGAALSAVAEGADLDPSTYSTSITGDQLIAAGYLLETWRMTPATAIATNYSSAAANALQTIGSTTARLLTNTTTGNSLTGYYIQLNFWVMAQSASNLRLNYLNIDGQTGGTGTVDTALEQSLRVAVTSRLNTAGWLYGNDIDYTFTFAGTPQAATTPITTSNFNTVAEKVAADSLTVDYTTINGVVGDSSGTAGSVIQPMTANLPVIVSVRFFIEGWDSDATNYIIGAPVKIEFRFTIA